jgi:regulator of protease activity HflC (stomatin/prohibitin superfamily)
MEERENRTAFGWVSATTAALTVVALFFSTFATVSTRNVGIVTSFGRPVGSLDNGPHFILPWESVTEMPATVQTDSYDQKDHNCVTVRIAYGMSACLNVSIRWRIREQAADSLFQNYQDFSNVRFSLVDRDLGVTANKVFADYNPLAFDAEGNSLAPKLSVLSGQLESQMKETIGSQIDIQSVYVPLLNYDASVQARINAIQSQVGDTKVALQRLQTNQAESAANNALATSVNNSPGVLESRCLDELQRMIDKGMTPPVGFNCGSLGSSTSGVIVQGR